LSQGIVFVGGVHGAGKTTMSRRLAVALAASHVTAGTLIRETANYETITAGIGNKAVPDVNANQELLLRGLAQYRRSATGLIVLDGHFSLMEPSGATVAIPVGIFLAIAPIAIVLVKSDPRVVHSRLLQRDGAAPPLERISSFSESERVHAQAVSTALNVPMFIVRGDLSPEEESDITVPELLLLIRGAT